LFHRGGFKGCSPWSKAGFLGKNEAWNVFGNLPPFLHRTKLGNITLFEDNFSVFYLFGPKLRHFYES